MRKICLLSFFVASVLATDNKNYNGQPMDYFDDDFQSNLKVGPDSSFSFNFEQTTRDQPPEIEIREENVGRYIRTRPQPTTPASTFSMKTEKESQHVYPTMMSADNYQHQQGHSNEPQVTSIPLPPKFASSRANNNRQNPEKNSTPTWNSPSIHQNDHPGKLLNDVHPRGPSDSTPTSHPVQNSESPKTQNTPSSHPKGVEGIRFAPSASYVSDSITSDVPRQPPSLANRGKHKFSWNDIKKPKEIESHDIHPRVPSVSTTTSHPVQNSEPPKTQSSPSPNYTSSHPQGVEGIRFAPSASYVSDSITSNVPRQSPSLANRGKHKFSWNDIKKPKEIESHDIHPRVPSVSTTTSHPVQNSEPPKTQSTPSPNYASSHPQGVEGIRFAPSASYVSDSITNNVPRQPPSLANRGKHKFSWNDIKKPEEIKPPQTSSIPQPIPNKLPPPVPTLSPWYDNFGK